MVSGVADSAVQKEQYKWWPWGRGQVTSSGCILHLEHQEQKAAGAPPPLSARHRRYGTGVSAAELNVSGGALFSTENLFTRRLRASRAVSVGALLRVHPLCIYVFFPTRRRISVNLAVELISQSGL